MYKKKRARHAAGVAVWISAFARFSEQGRHGTVIRKRGDSPGRMGRPVAASAVAYPGTPSAETLETPLRRWTACTRNGASTRRSPPLSGRRHKRGRARAGIPLEARRRQRWRADPLFTAYRLPASAAGMWCCGRRPGMYSLPKRAGLPITLQRRLIIPMMDPADSAEDLGVHSRCLRSFRERLKRAVLHPFLRARVPLKTPVEHGPRTEHELKPPIKATLLNGL